MKNKIFNILKYIFIICSVLLSGYLVKIINDLDILPSKYYWTIVIGLIILNIIGAVCLLVKKIWAKIISIVMYIIIFLISIIGINYGSHTLEFFKDGFDNKIEEITKYDVVVLKDSAYQELKDLDSKSMGYISTDLYYKELLSMIDSKVSSDMKEYTTVYDLYEDLLNKKVDSMIIDEAYLDILKDDYEDIDGNIRVIHSFELATDYTDNTSNTNSNSNVVDSNSNSNKGSTSSSNKTKFKADNGSINIYISGSDSRSGTIKSKTRTDVNMIMTINPNTKTILLTSIPRDYYVRLHGTSGYKDKLTHSGIYGIDMSKETIEDLLGIEIDYTVKVGFNSVIKLVNLVGGIDVYSDTSFTAYCSDGGARVTYIKKGNNHFDGGEALCFVRQRKNYSAGDKKRIQNQQLVLEAIIKKATTNKTLLLKYEEFLNSFKSLYRTDMPNSVIKTYIKNQLNDMSSWKIQKQYLDGSSAYRQTYSMPGRNLYVIIPSESSVNKSSNKIISVMKGN